MSHASTASWALSLLPSGITSALSAVLAWIEHLPGAVILLIFVVIFAIIFLCTLAWLGRREQQRCAAPPSKEIDLHQFLRFVGIDPMDPMSRDPPLQNKANDAFGKLRQLSRDGDIRLRGKPGFKYGSAYMSWKPAELIEPAYWRDAQIFCLDVLGKGDVSNISTMPDDAMGKGKSDAFVYKGLTIIEDDIKAHFKNNEFSNWGLKQ